jgi:hypothetical protein
MVADRKKTAGQSKGAEPETQGQASAAGKSGGPETPPPPPADSAAGEKAGGTEGQGQPPAEGSTTAKRKPWIKKTPVEIILEQVKKQEEKVTKLKEELENEESALKTMRDATKLLGGS